MSSTPEIRMVTMTAEEYEAALRDLEGLAKAGGMSNDDIADVYSKRISELEEEE